MTCAKWKVPIVITCWARGPSSTTRFMAGAGSRFTTSSTTATPGRRSRKADGLIAVAAAPAAMPGAGRRSRWSRKSANGSTGRWPVGRDRHRRRGAGSQGDGRRFRLYRLALHRHARSGRPKNISRRSSRAARPTSSPRRCSPASAALSSAPRSSRRPGPGQPAAARARRDELPVGNGRQGMARHLGIGQGIGVVDKVTPPARADRRLTREYAEAKARVCG